MLKGFRSQGAQECAPKRGDWVRFAHKDSLGTQSWGEDGKGTRTELLPLDRLAHGKGSLEM